MQVCASLQNKLVEQPSIYLQEQKQNFRNFPSNITKDGIEMLRILSRTQCDSHAFRRPRASRFKLSQVWGLGLPVPCGWFSRAPFSNVRSGPSREVLQAVRIYTPSRIPWRDFSRIGRWYPSIVNADVVYNRRYFTHRPSHGLLHFYDWYRYMVCGKFEQL